MDASIAAILTLDGLANGAVYALLAMATVLVFAVTRVIFIPQGEFVAYGALTLAMLQLGRLPGTVWLALLLSALVALREAVSAPRSGLPWSLAGRRVASLCAWPLAAAGVVAWLASHPAPLWVQAVATVLLVTGLGPLVYRLAYQPVSERRKAVRVG